MNASLLKNMIPIAVGAGVMIGAAGVFLYNQIFRDKRRILLQKEVANLDFCITELKRELEALKRLQKASKSKKSGPPTVRSEVETEVFSVYDDEGEEEFYDFSESDEEGLSLADAKREALGSKYDDIDGLLEGNGLDHTKAYGILLDLLDKTPNDPDILWRLAKVCHAISGNVNIENDLPKRQDFLSKGVNYAEECLKVAPRSSDAHKWYAICVGARSQNLSRKEKVKDGLVFKKHVEEALEITPEDATLHHLLGRFKFEVAALSWLERKVASKLFCEIPYASFEEALESLFRAEELSNEPWKENRLLIAKCYLNLNDLPTAHNWLLKAKEVEIISPEDRVGEFEINSLLEKYQNNF